MALMSIINPAGDSFVKYISDAAGTELQTLTFEVHVVNEKGENIPKLLDIDTEITYIHPRLVPIASDGSFTLTLVGLDTANGIDDAGNVLVVDGQSIVMFYSIVIRQFSNVLFKFTASIPALPSPRTLEEIINSAFPVVPGSSIFNTGIPAGGTTGQHLAKLSGADFNADWVDPPTGTFLDEQGFPNLATGTNTAFGSTMEWASTANAVVTMEYVCTQVVFGNSTFGASGSIRIIIQGNATANVALSDENRFEIDLSNAANIVFSVDVSASVARLLYTSTSITAIRFFNIKYTTYTNSI